MSSLEVRVHLIYVHYRLRPIHCRHSLQFGCPTGGTARVHNAGYKLLPIYTFESILTRQTTFCRPRSSVPNATRTVIYDVR
jgi:hypothetical protein